MFPKKLNNKRAVAILRISSRRQEGNNSHQVQEDKIRDYCNEYALELVDIHRIIESAKTSSERIKYSAAIQSALKNNIFNILFYMNDREARNLTDNEKNELLVSAGKICIHYVNDRKILHKDSPASDFLMRDFYAVQNKNFSRVLSEKVNDAMRKKAGDGWFPGNLAPLGYIHQKQKDLNGRELKRGTIIIPDTDVCRIRWVRREFQLRSEGKTIQQVRDQLLQEGLIPASNLRTYSLHGVEERLKNKFYWGYFDWQGVEYKGKHEPIIDSKILQIVKASFGIKGKYNRNKYLESNFSGGWLRCGKPECGLQITYDPKNKKIISTGETKQFKYYRCANSRKLHDKLIYVPEEKIWNQLATVVDKVNLHQALAQKISNALNELNEKAKGAVKRDIANYQVALDRLDEKRDQTFDMFTSKLIDQDEYKRQSQRLQDERRHYTRLLEESQLAINDAWKTTAERVFELAINAKTLWDLGSVEQKLELLKRLCSNPVLDGPTIRYELKKPFTTIAEMRENEKWRSLWDSNPCYIREREVS